MNVFVWTVCNPDDDEFFSESAPSESLEGLLAEAMDPWVELYATFEEAEKAVRRADERVREDFNRVSKNLGEEARLERCDPKWDEECHSTRRPPLAFRSWRWQSPNNGDYHLIREMPLRGGEGVK